jgi:hypothetical protein
VKITVFVLTVMLAGVLSAQQGPDASPVQRPATGPVNRYQLVTARVENDNTEEPTVFMIDTVTGRVWKFQGPFVVRKAGGEIDHSVQEMFTPVLVLNFEDLKQTAKP